MRRFEVAEEIVIRCYEDLEKLPGFATDIPEDTLRGIRKLASYEMPAKIKCGILECHQPHKEGCAIRRADGVVTNIGHCCAGRLLGEAWLHIKNEYRARYTCEGSKRQINTFLDEHNSYIQQCFSVWYDGGAQWLDSTRANFLEGAPQTLCDALLKRAQSGATVVTQTREREKSDWAAHLGFSSRDSESEMITIPVGNLSGLNSLRYATHDLVYKHVFLRVQHWVQRDLAEMDDSEIKECVQELRALPQRLKRVNGLVAEGRAFFSRDNFALFAPLLEQDCRAGASNALKYYEWDFDLCRWAVSPKLGLTRRSGRAA